MTMTNKSMTMTNIYNDNDKHLFDIMATRSKSTSVSAYIQMVTQNQTSVSVYIQMVTQIQILVMISVIFDVEVTFTECECGFCFMYYKSIIFEVPVY